MRSPLESVTLMIVLLDVDTEDEGPVLAKFRFKKSFWSFSASKVFVTVLFGATPNVCVWNSLKYGYESLINDVCSEGLLKDRRTYNPEIRIIAAMVNATLALP